MTRWAARLSIRARIVLLALAIVLPVMAVVGWLLHAQAVQFRRAALAGVEVLAEHTVDDLDHLLQRAATVMATLAEHPTLRALDPNHCDAAAAAAHRLDPDFGALTVRDRQGRLVCGQAPAEWSAEDAAAFEAALKQGGFHVGPARRDPQTGRWMLVLTQPVRRAAGEVAGLVMVPIDLPGQNALLMSDRPKSAVVTVIAADRTVLFQSVAAGAAIGSRLGAESAGEAGARRVVVSRPVPGVDWQVIASLPEAEAAAGREPTLAQTLAIGAGVSLLVGLLAWRLSAAIARPIVALADTAAAVAAGRPDLRANAEGDSEVAFLARQFNRALDARQESETSLAESEVRYRTLVDWSPEALSVHVDGTVRFVNQACIDLLGAASAADLLGKASIDFIHPDSRPRTVAEVAGMLGTGNDLERVERTFVRVDGSPVEVEVHGTSIVYEGRQAVLASMRDITERKRSQIALATSEAQLRGIFETATVAIVTIDESQRIVRANPAAAAIFRCPIEALIGAPLERLIPLRHRDAHRLAVQRFGDSGHSVRVMGGAVALTGLRSDGEEFPIDAEIAHMSVAGASLSTVILRDMTERQRAEAALRETEASLRRLLVMLPEPVFVNRGGRISFANAAAERLFGVEAAGLVGRPPLELVHPRSLEFARSRIDNLNAGLATAPLAEVSIVRADGSVRVVESAATLVDDHGEPSIVVVLRDVTELSEARHALAESHAELRRLVGAQDRVQEEERQRIARELHDDLQQTLAAIKIDLVSIGQRLPAAGGEVANLLAETAGLAATAIDSTRRIINDLRPQMLEDLGLVPALEVLASQFTRRTGIDCRVRTDGPASQDAAVPLVVATCLYRVAQEALNNAARHSAARKVRLTFGVAPDGSATLRVRDDGRGMVVGQRRKPESFGLLGMQERVRALGATLRIDSRPGAGTTIEVTVPAAPHPRPADVPDVAPRLAAVVDALDGNVAVLDRQGAIVLVNSAWREFADHNGEPGMPASGPGANYVEVCRRSAQADPSVAGIVQGLESVLDGTRAAFVCEYPCATAEATLWCRMRAAPLDEAHVLVSHVVISVEAARAAV